jgi:hypothetical protein
MEQYTARLGSTRREWFALPIPDRLALMDTIAKMDESAVARMKTAARRAVKAGAITEKFLEEFYADLDTWLSELKIKESSLPVWKKAAIITYARDLVV